MPFFRRKAAATPDALTNQGMQHLEDGNPAAAIESFASAVKVDPEHGQAWYGKGCAHSELEQYEEAIRSYEESAKYAGDRVALPLFNMGNSYQELGDLQQAAKCFHEAAQADPTMADAWINLGRILDDSGQHETAVEIYDTALKIDPEDSMAWSNRGNSLRALERFEDALESYRQALEIDSDDFASQIGQGACLMETGNEQQGLEVLEQSVEATQHPLAVFEFATALGKVEQHEAALVMYDMLIEHEFVSPELLNNRGECLAKQDRLDDSLTSFDRAIELDAEFWPAYFGKARVLVKAERIDEARPVVEHLCEIGDERELSDPSVQALCEVCGVGQ